MLFATPTITERDVQVIEGIEEHRARLKDFLRVQRRWKGHLRRNLRARAIRGSNSIEGYDVSLDDALALMEDEEPLDADQQTRLEIVGYRNAMTYIQSLAGDEDFILDQSLIRSLHYMMLSHDSSKSPGQYRKSAIFVKDEDRGEIVYEGPDSDLCSALMNELVADVARSMTDDSRHMLVTAAMAHLNLVMIHPFRDGNGRMARALQTLVLARNQVLTPEFSSIEEWLGRNTDQYYSVLAEVGGGFWQPARDAGPWITFNLRAHHMQSQTVWRRVLIAEDLWTRLETLAARLKFPPRTISALFNASMGLRLHRTQYQVDAEIEGPTASRDLRQLVEEGLLEARGETRGRYYMGSARLRREYAELRQRRDSTLIDPYTDADAHLGPQPRASRRLMNTTEA